MRFIDFTIDIPETEFPSAFRARDQVQRMMNKAEIIQATYLKNVYDHKEDEVKDKNTYADLIDELAWLEDRIPILNDNLDKAGHQKNIDSINEELSASKLRRDKIKKRLKNRDEVDLIVERMVYQKNRMFAHGVDEWVDKLGNWFSTGVLGPGTVTFREKTYTAQ